MGMIGTDARIKIAVSPILVCTNEKYLNAGLPPFDMQRDNIRFADRARIDTLVRLHLGHSANAITQCCGAFELHCFTGLRHFRCKAFLNFG